MELLGALQNIAECTSNALNYLQKTNLPLIPETNSEDIYLLSVNSISFPNT